MKTIISIIIIFLVAASGWYFLRTPNASTPLSPTEVSPQPAAAVKIVAFGDSLTAGYGLPLSDSYPAQLEKSLREKGYAVTVINSGVSGETTAGNNQRADFIRAQNPNIVILGIGGNDILRLLPTADVYNNIKSTLAKIISGKNPPQVLLLSIQAPSNAGGIYKKSFDTIYPKLASEFSIPLVPFIVPEVSLNPKLLQADGIHPTKEGYTVLVDSYILPAVERSLEQSQQ